MLRVVWAVSLFLSTCSLLLGQANTGTILGRVTDPSGAVVPGAKITARNEQTGTSKEYMTSSSGDYIVSYLIPGSYDVTAKVPSFKRAVRSGVTVEVDQKALVNFTLEVGTVNESVEVKAEAPLVQSQSVEQSQVITQKVMQELPLDIRDYGQLASLQAWQRDRDWWAGQQLRRRQPASHGRGGACERAGSGCQQLATGWSQQ